MAIKNSLFWLAQLAIVSGLLVSISGCNLLKKRSGSQQTTKEAPIGGDAPEMEVPQFVGKQAPRVGIILGPGGAKTFAHIGVLQELEQNKIPIVAVAGLGWGALAGGLYALNGEVHELDWKMSQIPKVNFSSSTFFSSKRQSVEANSFDAYLKKVFMGERIQRTKIPFTCPYISSAGGEVKMARSGSASGYVKACWQYPPLFKVADVMGAPFAIGGAVNFLKLKGAELIIFVDVLGRAHKKDFVSWEEPAWSWFAWAPVVENIKYSELMGVHEKIIVDTTSYTMVDVEQRLRLIQLGRQEAGAAIEKIVKKYDF